MIDPQVIDRQGFFLYAETYLPNEQCRDETLEALASCADGTIGATPGVGTYVFRPSLNAEIIGQRLHPGCVCLESTELYLTHAGFRDHLETPEFRSGLRAMYKGTTRLGARLFWCGEQPPSDMLHNIFRSDPEARPLAPLALTVFDREVYDQTENHDTAIVSLSVPIEQGAGARAIDAVQALRADVRHISLFAFFHPLDTDLLRLTVVLPLAANDTRQHECLSQALSAIAETREEGGVATGVVCLHDQSPASEEILKSAFSSCYNWSIRRGEHTGYISHPEVSTE